MLESRIAPIPLQRRSIPVTPSIRDMITDLLKKPVSASLLDSYLRCPARFFHERLIRLTPADEISEGDDPLAVGTLFHEVLQQFYAPYLGMPLPGGEILAGRMERELLSCLFASPFFAALTRSLPADSAAMLVESGKKRLADYLLNQPPTTVLALESSLKATFSRDGGRWSLTGMADRIDLRSPPARQEAQGREPQGEEEQHIVIIDYKTGRLPSFSPFLWEDDDLWQRLEAWQPGVRRTRADDAAGLCPARTREERRTTPPGMGEDGRNASLLTELASRLESIQLPFYLLLYDLAVIQQTIPYGRADISALDAVWVPLAHNGEEAPLFPQNFSRARRLEMVRKRIPSLVSFLLRHISESIVLEPRPGKHCDWCSSAKLCIIPLASERIS
jgi:hypothetical protein